MKVILLDNIRGVGRVGDVKEVADGYARNFLLARGKAKAASAASVREAVVLQSRKREAMSAARDEAAQLLERMAPLQITVQAVASPKGKLFAAVDPSLIAERLSDGLQTHFDASQIHPLDHLKSLGEHVVGIDLPGGLSGRITVIIEPAER